jgi:dimethylhistidine N-methyltransferase
LIAPDSIPGATTPAASDAARLRRYQSVRARTLALTTPLSAEDQVVQSMPDASPAKWHQAHTTWFFETFLLVPFDPSYRLFDPIFGYLFNSYYEAAGPRWPRPARGLITRPALAEVRAYRRHVDEAMARLLERSAGADPKLAGLVDLGLAHEEQHQELMLMDVLNLFSQMPGDPAYRAAPGALAGPAGAMGGVDFAGGLTAMGHDGEGFAFDNEGPRHEVFLAPYRLADRLVTNGEWLEFVEAGGYLRPDSWLSDGWTWLETQGRRHPAYWRQDEHGAWREMTLGGLAALKVDAPAAHVSYYEADAFARWAGARLPSEAEWEHAAAGLPPDGGLIDLNHLHAAGAGRGSGLRQMFGVLWQWTRSAYAPYPGFEAARDAVGEYNGKFMVNQMVLRGGCFASPPGHVRATYRNFFHPHQSWQFSGVRLAWDAPRRREPPPLARSDLDAGLGEHGEPTDAFLRDVIEGLGATPKRLPSKYFYDDRGSTLFEAICALPEYYPTRMETALLAKVAGEIAGHISPNAALIEFGSGASVKTRLLLDAAPQVGVYIPMDISREALARAAADIRSRYHGMEVSPWVGDFTQPIQPPPAAERRPRTGFFPGSTIGNFSPDEAVAFLASARRLLGGGAQFIVGVDLVKDVDVLTAAYNDAQGVTAAFNLNLLARINRELDGRLDVEAFEHRALWNDRQQRMEMHLVSRADQRLMIGDRQFAIARGESIHTENSHKFTLRSFADLAERAGWRVGPTWVSPNPEFAVFLLQDWR